MRSTAFNVVPRSSKGGAEETSPANGLKHCPRNTLRFLQACPYAFYVLRAENRRQSWLVFSVYRQVKTNQKLAGY